MEYRNKIDSLILFGSNEGQGLTLKVGEQIVKMAMIIKGRKTKSKFIDSLIFGDFNKKVLLKKQLDMNG